MPKNVFVHISFIDDEDVKARLPAIKRLPSINISNQKNAEPFLATKTCRKRLFDIKVR